MSSFDDELKINADAMNKIASGEKVLPSDYVAQMRLSGANEIYNVPADQVKDHITRGYHIVTPTEIKFYDQAKEAGTLGKVALGAFNTADQFFTGGLAGYAIKKGLPEEQAGVIEQIGEQSVVPTLGTIVGLGGSLVGGPVKAAVESAEKISEKAISSIAKGAGAAEKSIATKAAENGATSVIGNIASKAGDVAKVTANKAAKGVMTGTILGAPFAGIDLAFGDTQQAGESLLISAGIGGALEGIIGGGIQGVKSISGISDSISESTKKLIKSTYGIGKNDAEKIIDGSLDNYALDIRQKAEQEAKANLQRRLQTLEGLGISPYELPAEAVFQKGAKQAEAAKIEKIAMPFQEESALTEQRRNIIETAEQKAMEEVGKVTKGIESYPENEVDNIVSNKIFTKMNDEAQPFIQKYQTMQNLINPLDLSAKETGLLSKENRLFNIKNSVISDISREIPAESSAVKTLRNEVKRRLEEATDGQTWNQLMNDFRSERKNLFKSLSEDPAKEAKGNFYSKVIDSMENANGKMIEAIGGSDAYSTYKQANKEYGSFMKKYGEAFKMMTGKKATGVSSMLDSLDREEISEKLVKKLFDPKKDLYKNKTLQNLFPEEFKIASASKIKDVMLRHTKEGVLNVRGMLNEIDAKWTNPMKEMIFGESGKKLISDLNHLFGGIKNVNSSIAHSIGGDLINASTGAGGLLGGVLGGASGAAIGAAAVKGVKSVKNIIKIMKLNSEKEAIIKAALDAEAEQQTANAAKAVMKINQAHKEVSSWAKNIFSGGKIKLEPIYITAVQKHKESQSVEDEYKKNIEIAQKASANSDFQKQQIFDKANSFKAIPGVHLNYSQSASNAIDVVKELSNGYFPAKKNSFFKVPDIKPSKNQMIQFNTQMRALKNPFKIVEDLSNGIVNQEAIKIASAVYPSTVNRIKQTVLSELMKSENLEASYQDRLKLSHFLGVDLDGSMTNLAIFSQNSEQSNNQELQQVQKQLKMSVDMKSPTQDIGELT